MAELSDAEKLKMRLYSAANDDGISPRRIFVLLGDAIEAEIWQELGMSFRELMERPWPEGLGLTQEQILTFIELPVRYEEIGDEGAARVEWVRKQVKTLLLEPMPKPQRGPGRGKKTADNVSRFEEHGNSESYAIRRLRRDRPDLAELVLVGEMSANAAAIEAGFRKRSRTIPADLEGAARALAKHYDPDELAAAMKAVGKREI